MIQMNKFWIEKIVYMFTLKLALFFLIVVTCFLHYLTVLYIFLNVPMLPRTTNYSTKSSLIFFHVVSHTDLSNLRFNLWNA